MNPTIDPVAVADELRAASDDFHAVSCRALDASDGGFEAWAEIIRSPEYAAAEDRYRAALARARALLRHAQRQGDVS